MARIQKSDAASGLSKRDAMRTWLRPIPVGAVGRASGVMFVAMGARGVIVATYLVLMTRWLGAMEYGRFAGAASMVLVLAPAAGWGAALLLQRRIAQRTADESETWRTALVQVAVVGCALSLLALTLGYFLSAPVGLKPLLLLAAAELVALPIALLAASALQVKDRPVLTGVTVCVIPAMRLIALLPLLLLSIAPSLERLVTVHLTASVAGAVAALVIVRRTTGLTLVGRASATSMWAEGTPYAVGAVLGLAHLELDKLLIFWLVGADELGSYAAAFRVAAITTIPVAALSSVLLPRLMASGPFVQARLGHAALLAAVASGLGASAVLAICAQWASDVFGAGFEASSRLILAFIPWVFLYSIRLLLCNFMTGVGLQLARIKVELVGLIVLCVSVMPLVAGVGVSGAAWALALAEMSVILGACVGLCRHSTRMAASDV